MNHQHKGGLACVAREGGTLGADGRQVQSGVVMLVDARHARVREPAGVRHQEVTQVACSAVRGR